MDNDHIIQHKARAVSSKTRQWVALAATRVWLRIRDVMTQSVVTVVPTASLAEAAAAMARHGVSCVVVLEDDQIRGILTDKDVVREVHQARPNLYQRKVAEFMTRTVGCVDPDQTIVEASRVMEARRVHRLPVVEGGRLVGIVSQTDLTRALTSSHALQDVGQIMSTEVAIVPQDATVAAAAEVMSLRGISSVVVVEAGQPKGILTERDIVRKVTAVQKDPSAVLVADIITCPLITVAPAHSVFCASRMMDQMHIHRLAVVEDKRLVGIVTQTDIFRATQRLLQAEEEKALQLFDSSKTGVYILDTEGCTLYLNPAFLGMLEIDDPSLLIDQPFLPALWWADPADREPFMENLRQGNVQVEEILLKTGKGNPLHVSVVSTFLRDIHGRISGINGALHDVTAKRLAEQASVVAYERLEKANRDLKLMQSQIVQSEKLASIGQLAAGVAHELNTPVGFVAGNFEALRKYVQCLRQFVGQYDELGALIASMDHPDLKAKLSQIQDSRRIMKIGFILDDIQSLFDESKEGIDRVTTIVRNLRDFSRIDQGDKLEPYDINRGLEATLTVARNEIKYDAEVVKELGEVVPIQGHPGQINQVLLNLLVNAAQAIRSQGRAETDKGTITVRTSMTEDHVVCQITDNGPGIAPEHLDHMFQAFFTTKPAGKGTGLGLSVSYDIVVNKHGGQLLVDSVPGRKTTFTIKLPKTKVPISKSDPVLVETPANG